MTSKDLRFRVKTALLLAALLVSTLTGCGAESDSQSSSISQQQNGSNLQQSTTASQASDTSSARVSDTSMADVSDASIAGDTSIEDVPDASIAGDTSMADVEDGEYSISGRIISIDEGTQSLVLAADDVYTLSFQGAAAFLNGKSVETAALRPGMTAEFTYDGGVMESWPAQIASVRTIKSDGYPEDEKVHDVCGLYLQVLSDLWDTDTGLNENRSYISLDLADAPGDLSPAEIEAIAWIFSSAHNVSYLTLSYKELAAEGYLGSMAEEWRDGILFSISKSATAGKDFIFDAQKWVSALGADSFLKCTVECSADGTWKSYNTGVFGIS